MHENKELTKKNIVSIYRVLLNSSSFSAILLSISCLTCPSSSWALRTLFSSASRAPSASSRADCSSSFSAYFQKNNILYTINVIVLCYSITADEWKHETDCTVRQNDSINLVHSKTKSNEFNFFLVFANIPLLSKSLVNFPSGA